jgi:O-antigen biosynthesis protein
MPERLRVDRRDNLAGSGMRGQLPLSTSNGGQPSGVMRTARAPVRVCIVSWEILGPFRNGGVGTAYTKLAEALSDAGHEVTFLYTSGRYSVSEPIENWIEHYSQRGIRLVPLPDSPVPTAAISSFLCFSYRVYLWLRDNDQFDVVHFAECGAQGFHSLTAQAQGLILQNTVTVVGLHSPTSWLRAASEQLLCSGVELEHEFVERRSAEQADVVWSPGRFMLDWVKARGWNISKRTLVKPYITPVPPRLRRPRADGYRVRELVFFGRQEVRKGLFLFMDAVDRLAPLGCFDEFRELSVTFLGRATSINGVDSEQLIRERSARWPCRTTILAERSYKQGIKYLQGEGRLALICSLDENYPNTVLECLSFGVPFLASRVGSIPEQIHSDDVDRVCFQPAVRSLTERLARVLSSGHAPARHSFEPDENTRGWVNWHESQVARSDDPESIGQPGSSHERAGDVKVSVCIIHRGRVVSLRRALDSVLEQDEPPLEVIVVSDNTPGSAGDDALEEVAHEYDFEARGWQVARCRGGEAAPGCDRTFAARARRCAAAFASGDYLLFLDDDTRVRPRAISTLNRVARHTGSDALLCLIDVYADGQVGQGDGHPAVRWLPSGASHPLSALYNTFGLDHAMVRRDALLASDGPETASGTDAELWEVLSAMIQSGFKLEIVPEALVWHRASGGATIPAIRPPRDYLAALRPHLEKIPVEYHAVFELGLGQSIAGHQMLWDGSDPMRGDAAVIAEPALPLRYELADSLHVRLRRFSRLHAWSRTSIDRLLRLRRRIKAGVTFQPRSRSNARSA